MSTQMRFMA